MSLSRPSLQGVLIFLAAAVGVTVTFSLGMWQLGRGEEKLALQAAKEQRMSMTVLDGRSLQAHMAQAQQQSLMYRAMSLKGHWLKQHTVYLDNRQMNGHAGFYVVTPMRLEGTGQVVLVQRGWAPRTFNERSVLPRIETPEGQVEVMGTLAPWPSRMYDFGGVEDGLIRQNLDLSAFQHQTGVTFQNLSLIQTGPPSEGLLREWPQVASGVEKHHGYAFQWFGLCALTAILYVWFQIVQTRRKT